MDEDAFSLGGEELEEAAAAMDMGADIGPLSAAQALADVRARQKAFDAATTSNQDLFKQAMARLQAQRAGPSSAEKLFAIAAALQKPTRTGSFFETLGNVGGAMSEAEKAKREAMADRDTLLEKYGLAQSSASLDALKAQLAASGQTYRAAMAAETARAKAGRPKFLGVVKNQDGTNSALFQDPATEALSAVPVDPNMPGVTPSPDASAIPPQAVADLRANPALAADFDQEYGFGKAKLVLGGQ
jgi:hypothetical protein